MNQADRVQFLKDVRRAKIYKEIAKHEKRINELKLKLKDPLNCKQNKLLKNTKKFCKKLFGKEN